jgi:hypothetical protein
MWYRASHARRLWQTEHTAGGIQEGKNETGSRGGNHLNAVSSAPSTPAYFASVPSQPQSSGPSRRSLHPILRAPSRDQRRGCTTDVLGRSSPNGGRPSMTRFPFESKNSSRQVPHESDCFARRWPKNAQKDTDARTGAPHAIVRCHSVRNRRTRCARRGPARAEHVFGNQQSSMGGKIARTIGIVRARFKIDESRLQMSAPG